MTRGGARKGAGRKASTDGRTVVVAVRYTVPEAALLDEARGIMSRSDIVRGSSLAWLTDGRTKKDRKS